MYIIPEYFNDNLSLHFFITKVIILLVVIFMYKLKATDNKHMLKSLHIAIFIVNIIKPLHLRIEIIFKKNIYIDFNKVLVYK